MCLCQAKSAIRGAAKSSGTSLSTSLEAEKEWYLRALLQTRLETEGCKSRFAASLISLWQNFGVESSLTKSAGVCTSLFWPKLCVMDPSSAYGRWVQESRCIMSQAAAFASRCMLTIKQLILHGVLTGSLLATAKTLGETCAGVGSLNFAAAVLRRSAAATLDICMLLRPQFATEWSPKCRVLLEELSNHQHEFIFGNVLDRVPPLRSQVGVPFDILMTEILNMPFFRAMWCFKHQAYCAPAEETDIICGGFPCQDHSPVGPGTGMEGRTAPTAGVFFREI